MKRKQIVAIIGAFTMCFSIVTPVLAAEPQSVESEIQDTSEQSEEAKTTEEVVEGVTVEKDSATLTNEDDSTSTGENGSLGANVAEEPQQQEKVDGNVEEQPSITNEAQEAFTGWNEDHTSYYVNGEKLTEKYCQIDGVYYGFGVDGQLCRNYKGYLENLETTDWDPIRTDENGMLINQWYTDSNGKKEYYDNYIGVRDTVITIDDLLYYFDSNGWLLVDQDHVYNGQL